jgi:hypothetical protein
VLVRQGHHRQVEILTEPRAPAGRPPERRTDRPPATETPQKDPDPPANTGLAPAPVVDTPRPSQGGATADPPPRPTAECLAELVERLQRFHRAGRPALAMTLRAIPGARLELQRTGPRAVSLTWAGRGPKPDSAQIAQLRDALAQRDLTLSSLVVEA